MFNKHIIKNAMIILFISIFTVGCGSLESNKKEGLQIVTSISIIADITENIVGNRGQVSYLVPIGDSPEDYEAIPSDLKKVSVADVVFLNGWSLEEGIERAISHIANSIVFVTDGITPIPLVGENLPDPHAWFDVILIRDFYVNNILKELIKIDPDGEEDYLINAEIYKSSLSELDNWIKEEVKKIPQRNKIIVINENALKYYGSAYGFQTEGIWELNSHEEGTSQQISRVIEIVRKNSLPAIFSETTIDEKYMRIISTDTGVPIGGKLYTDALGLPDNNAETYIKMMKHNTNVLVNKLKN